HGGKSRPCRDGGGGEIVRFFASVRKGDRACNIDPPTSSYAIMRRACPYRGENSGPGKDDVESLTPRPGIREHNREYSAHAVMEPIRALVTPRQTLLHHTLCDRFGVCSRL